MKHTFAFTIVAVSVLLLSACAKLPSSHGHPIIEAYSESWNEKNVQKMAALMHPQIQWLSVKGNTINVEISGKSELVEAMQKWFEDADLPAGSLRDWSLNGNFVAVTETATWIDDSGATQSQSSLTVYELEDDLIRRVYYYPSVKH
ncbi:nuclear transport factor 2 family protein [Aliiglaciecola litoralis]|uniref:SnoaL-like domain-containing protein n=1 Tax=Aliiglaciecola litoralis TaxID=582857 RepID=A0ABP3X218_9ALTE